MNAIFEGPGMHEASINAFRTGLERRRPPVIAFRAGPGAHAGP